MTPGLVAIGDAGIDCYVDAGGREMLLRAGGCTLNVAFNYARTAQELALDAPLDVIAHLGHDERSRRLERFLRQTPLACHVETQEGTTPTQYLRVEPNGERVFVRYDEGVLKDAKLSAEARLKLERAPAVATVVFRQNAALVDQILNAARGLVALDFMDLSDAGGDPFGWIEARLARVDLAFFGLSDPAPALLAALQGLARERGKIFVVTLGAAGSLVLSKDERHHAEAEPVEAVVDTTGAGDSFLAAFLLAYQTSGDLRAAQLLGHRVAARVIRQVGAFPADPL